MPRELVIGGVLMPSLLLAVPAALLVFAVVDAGLARLGAYRWFWHSDLVRMMLAASLFCGFGLALFG